MRPLLRAGVRHLARHGGQLGLTLLGVTLGVAIVVAMDLGIQSARAAFRVSSETIAGSATHQVVGGSAGVPDSLVAVLRRQSGMEAAAPVIEFYTTSPALPGRALRVLGVDPISEAPFRPYLGTSDGLGGEGVRGGAALLVESRSVVLSRSTAEAAGLAMGDELLLRRGLDELEFHVVGILDPVDERSRQGLQDLLVIDVAEAQDVLGRRGGLDRIDLRLAEGVSGEVGPLLPAGIRLETVGARAGAMAEMIRAFDLNLTALSLLGLVFGFFLVYNTMTFSVVQRRETIGLFRVLGTPRSQVLKAILIEAGAVGLAGSVVGVLAGIVLGRGLVRLVGRTINDLYLTVSVESLVLPPETLAKGVLLGLGATVLAAVPPAREAGRVVARDALRRSSIEVRARSNAERAAILGGALALAGGVVLALPGRSVTVAFGGLFAIIVGMALLTPVATVGAMGLLRPLLKRVLGVVGGMAARGVVTALSRTAPAMAALVIAVAVTMGLGVMIGSFRSSVNDWLTATLRADLYVSAPSAGSSRISGELPPALAERVRSMAGVAGVSESRVRDLGTGFPGARLIALRLSEAEGVEDGFDLLASVGADAMERFRAGEGILISEPLAYRRAIASGGTLELVAEDGPLTVPILGVFRDYATESGAVALSRTLYDRHWRDSGLTSLAVFLEAGTSEAEVEAAIRASLPSSAAIQVRSNRALRDLSLEVFDRTFAITRVLRLLAFLVAFIAVLSALMALQLEREREMGVLRAVGMTPRQTWGLITGQTGIMGVVAGVLAVPVGLVLAAVMIFVVNRRSFGWSIAMEVDPAVVWQGVLLAVAGALLAGVVPSRRIARASPAKALRGE